MYFIVYMLFNMLLMIQIKYCLNQTDPLQTYRLLKVIDHNLYMDHLHEIYRTNSMYWDR